MGRRGGEGERILADWVPGTVLEISVNISNSNLSVLIIIKAIANIFS